MDPSELNERIAALLEGTSTADRFAALCLTELLRELCQLERAGGLLVAWEWEDRVRAVAAVCDLDATGLWAWCADISADLLAEAEDPWT